jgi:hypothetical protein
MPTLTQNQTTINHLGKASPREMVELIQFKKGDKIEYKHPKASGWVEAVFESFYIPDLAPKNSPHSFIEILVKGKRFNAYSHQIRPVA